MKEAGGSEEFELEEQLKLLKYCEECRPGKAFEKFMEENTSG
jgi:hypothetical protein